MDDVLANLLGDPDEADEAEDYSSTAEDDEGALEPLDALEALDSPEDEADEDLEAEDEDTDEESADERLARLESERDQLVQERQRLAQDNERYAQERQMEALRHAQSAWQETERQTLQEASQRPDFQSAMQHVVTFYRNELQKVTSASQQLIAQAYAGQWIDQVTQDNGLTAEDKALLQGLPPERVPHIAQALARKNQQAQDKLSKIEADIQQLRRGQQSKRRTLTRADGLSGSRGASPKPQYSPGSVDNVLALMQATQAVKQRQRR